MCPPPAPSHVIKVACSLQFRHSPSLALTPPLYFPFYDVPMGYFPEGGRGKTKCRQFFSVREWKLPTSEKMGAGYASKGTHKTTELNRPQQRATVGKFYVGAEEFEEDYRRSLQMA